ncbi:Macrolide export ATP-binding/permease protein MacB [Planctomycetes bacterium CA13]|uniref:Macrolide export ATP-binding/permease protein MacB n=1 Tax=Novipirellula herctigrandis TaxID=2527986 RepID=A0A5C5ZBY7_9BACT|nr:Macrolide export ATP-binding/permease protein MacB [Planctomycetes bacterium CA13]
MNVFTLIRKEIGHRKLNFALSILAAAVAAATFLVSISLLRSTDLETSRLINEKVAETEAEMAKLEDELRVSMKGLGFNIHIFPEGQDLSEVYEQGYASKTMPEEYVTRLAQSEIVTVNHLLPTLTQVTDWPEYKRKIVLIGIRGEVPKLHGSNKKPLLDPVPEGELIVGYELQNSLELEVGDQVTLKGREFKIRECYGERGSKDDITVWMSLKQTQEIFDKEGQINSILALECNCATIDRLSEIRAELGEILPGTKIIEQESKALARAEARKSGQTTARQQIESMKESRSRLKEKREALASILIPLIGIFCMAGIGLLVFLNAKERVYEVGLLLALGVNSFKILTAFLLKAAVGGWVGGMIGIGASLLFIEKGGSLFAGYPANELTSAVELGLVLVCMPLFAAIASWIPAFAAAQCDPAEVLRNE